MHVLSVRSSLIVAAALLSAAACTSTSGGDETAITSTDTECRVATTDLRAGKNTFAVKNDGSEVTEVYVYAPGDRVVTEKENIGPGTTATFTADLTSGQYEIACKPGQKGDGIRQAVTVTGEGGSAAVTADRAVRVEALDYSFTGLENMVVRKGETIEFAMANRGTVEHEFEVLGPDGEALGEVGPTPAGKEGKVTLTFTEAGAYTFVCGIDDHQARGMTGSLTVT